MILMKLTKVLLPSLGASLLPLAANGAQQPEPNWATQALHVAALQAKAMLPRVLESGKFPRSKQNPLCPPGDWTSGFYPGMLWHLYGYTGDAFWRGSAEKVTAMLEQQQYNTEDHDIGFRIGCSYGNGWGATGNAAYAKVMVQAARSLATRFNDTTKTVRSWEPRPARDWKYPVIIDNMMNLELLMRAAQLSSDERLRQIAVAHADQTMQCQYRADFSCPHVVDYDPATGRVRKVDWNNGFSDPKVAAWSRGQAWGLYGFTMMYRETKYARYLKHAEGIAGFILNHPQLPKDGVPYWDFSAPETPAMRDASAAAIMASALVELSTYSAEGRSFFQAGEKILRTLASPQYLAEPGANDGFLLKHATGNFLKKSEVDGPLIYADYYFVEGLLRYLKQLNSRPAGAVTGTNPLK
jgi:unsaturated chondroitin disaccharide hydrolase